MTLINLLHNDFTKLTPKNFETHKRRWSKILKSTPKNSQILSSYKQLLKQNKIKPSPIFKNLLTTRKVRSLSGVTPMAIMTKAFYCPGKCTYCPLEQGIPKSYLSDEPAVQRALSVNFDPQKQINNRLAQLNKTGHSTSKLELIIIGGTFSAYPDSYKKQFFLKLYNTINNSNSKTLAKAQKLNQTAKRRIVGISIETRPDWITEKEIKLLRNLGVTKIQLGVQALDAKILKRIKRGHSINPIVKATKMLKNAGFKICYHYMPNLPGTTPKKDIQMYKKLMTDKRFKPDFIKIYPTQVIPKTELFNQYKKGEYTPYSDKQLIKVLTQIKLLTPPWCRIDRLVRDISKQWVAKGIIKTNLRQIIQSNLKKKNKKCKCIRCREIKYSLPDHKPNLKITQIKSLGAKEYFLQYHKNNKLYSLLRLRLPYKNQKMLFSELTNSAIIRELHTFGTVMPLKTRSKEKTQHQGLGKKLINKAEEIAKKKGFNKIAVISAVGTRDYYKKLGYHLKGHYMVKNLN